MEAQKRTISFEDMKITQIIKNNSDCLKVLTSVVEINYSIKIVINQNRTTEQVKDELENQISYAKIQIRGSVTETQKMLSELGFKKI